MRSLPTLSGALRVLGSISIATLLSACASRNVVDDQDDPLAMVDVDALSSGAPISDAVADWQPFENGAHSVEGFQVPYTDRRTARSIASFTNQNPRYRVTVEGSSSGRVAVVRGQLIEAGVPIYKIDLAPLRTTVLNNEDAVSVLVGT